MGNYKHGLTALILASVASFASANPWDQAQATANDALNTANAARSLSEQVNSKVDQTQANLDDMARCNGEYGNMAVCQGGGSGVDTSDFVTKETLKEHADADAVKNESQDGRIAVLEKAKDDFSSMISGNNWQGNVNKEDIKNLKNENSSQADDLRALKSGQASQDTAINTNRNVSIAAMQQAVDAQTAVDDLSVQVDAQYELSMDNADRLDATDDTISDIKSNVAEMDETLTGTTETANAAFYQADKNARTIEQKSKEFDQAITTEAKARIKGDEATLESAQDYADKGDVQTLMDSKAFTMAQADITLKSSYSYTDTQLGSYAERQARLDSTQNMRLGSLEKRMDKVESRVGKLEDRVDDLSGMMAGLQAASAIKLPAYTTYAIGVGVGTYDSYVGLAGGFIANPVQNTLINATVSVGSGKDGKFHELSSGNVAFAVGASYGW